MFRRGHNLKTLVTFLIALEMMSTTMANLMSRNGTTVEVGTEINIIGTTQLEETKAILGTKCMMILMM